MSRLAYFRRFIPVFSAAVVFVVAQAYAGAGTIGAVAVNPSSTPAGVATQAVFTATITDPSVIASTVQLQQIDVNGSVIASAGTMHDDGANGDAKAGDGIYSLQSTVYQTGAGQLRYRVAAGFKGALLKTLSAPIAFNVTGAGVGISILSPSNLSYVNTSPVNVTGAVQDSHATVKINGINAPVSSGKFLATVPLVEGVNTLTAVATNSGGTATTASVQITLDTTPPHITVDSPSNQSITTASSLTVTGTANDVVVGTINNADVQVTVNGIPAQVANRSYSAANVPLNLGLNKIQAVGRDRAGNGTTVMATVTRTLPSQPPQPSIGLSVMNNSLSLVSGNNQSGMIGTQVASPIVVQLATTGGQAVANQPVVFAVTGNNGFVKGSGAPAASATVNTDANGRAQVLWTLGQRSGAGINTVKASSTLAVAPVSFSATGTTSTPALIIVDSGNNQTGALAQPLAFPLVAAVTDAGHNRVPDVPVTFTVTKGGGNMAGKPSQTVMTDSNGRAIAVLTLGTDPGNDNNVVKASFPGNQGLSAGFAASAKAPGNPSSTTISGVVLDNSNNPIPGVTMRLFQTNQANNNNLPLQIGTPVQTSSKGTFLMTKAPVGFFKIMADGSTVPGQKAYPTLEYDIVTVAGQDNTVGMPMYLPALDPINKLCVDATHGGTLTLPQSPGFALTVVAGSATFPGGSKTGCISVTPVNGDKVPMAPGFGQQPRFIVTIQPVGTTFNPPAPITLPNVDGLKAREVTEMYSYDHDLSMFVAIGTGTVSNDGSVIVSNPGVGVLKAGWHCGGDPNSTGTAATCPKCETCKGDDCVADPSQDGSPDEEDKCKVCKGGALAPVDVDPAERSVSFTFSMPSETVDKINEDLKELRKIGVLSSLKTASIGGSITERECCSKETGKSTDTRGQVTGSLGSFSFQGKIWPPGPIPSIEVDIEVIGLASLKGEVVLAAGVFAGLEAKVEGTIGYRKDGCGEKEADRNGCVFANVTVPITFSLSGQITGQGEVTYDCIFCDKTKIAVEASLFFGNLQFPLNIASLSYNSPSDCTKGFQGGVLEWQPATFKIGGEFSGSWQTNDGVTQTIKFSKDILSCTISLTDGIKCPPYF